MSKPFNVALKDRGVELRELDLKASQNAIESALKDIEILVSAIGPFDLLDQIPLANAAKAVGVKRFVPDTWATIMPVGIHAIRDQKEVVLNHIKRIYLPFTVIDVGWYY